MKNMIVNRYLSVILLISIFVPVADSIACNICYNVYDQNRNFNDEGKVDSIQNYLAVSGNLLRETSDVDDVNQCICPVCSSAAEAFSSYSKALYSPAYIAEHSVLTAIQEPVFPISKPPLV